MVILFPRLYTYIKSQRSRTAQLLSFLLPGAKRFIEEDFSARAQIISPYQLLIRPAAIELLLRNPDARAERRIFFACSRRCMRQCRGRLKAHLFFHPVHHVWMILCLKIILYTSRDVYQFEILREKKYQKLKF